MDVKRYRHEWRVRWTTSAEEAAAAVCARAEDMCRACDHGGTWITVPDTRPMPKPSVVYGCPRCGMMTAQAALPVTVRSVAD